MDIIPLNRCQTSVIQTRRGGYRFWGPEACTVFGALFQEKKKEHKITNTKLGTKKRIFI